jgi:Na+-driven multidrug efflux pump
MADDGERRQEWMRWVSWMVIIGLALPFALVFLRMTPPWRVAVVVAALALLATLRAIGRYLRREE